MNEDVRRTTPPDDEISEYWERLPADEVYLRGVEAATGEFSDGHWQVTWHAGEYFRDEPFGEELRQHFKSALRAVPGVTEVEDMRWETWDVIGTPSGEQLCRAAAAVVDEHLDRMRAEYNAMFGQD